MFSMEIARAHGLPLSKKIPGSVSTSINTKAMGMVKLQKLIHLVTEIGTETFSFLAEAEPSKQPELISDV